MKDKGITGKQIWTELAELSRRTAEAEESQSGYRGALDILRLLKEAIETLPIGITISDTEGKIIYTNPAEAVTHGYTVEELVGKEARIFAPSELWKPLTFEELFEMGVRNRDSINIRKNGELFPVHLTSIAVKNAKGAPVGIVTACEDLTGRKHAEELLRETESLRNAKMELEKSQSIYMESEERFRTIAQTAVDAIILADSNGKIVFWNESSQNIFGYAEDEILGKPLTVLMPEQYREAHQQGIERLKATSKSKYIGRVNEMQGLRKDGHNFPIELAVSMWNVKGETFYSGIVRNITRRKQLEKELERLATTDKLTQAFNRTKFYEVIKKEMERAKRYFHPLSIVMFDIDHFKKINDTFGHAVGDSVLRTLTKIVRKNLRETDYLVRWGGEEFILIAPDTDLEKAIVLVERIRKEIESYKFNHAGPVTVSFGIAEYKPDDTEDALIKRADDAMYDAKRKGRNRVEVSA